MIVRPNSELIRYTGRWNVGETEAVSTANGSYIEFAFSGECAVLGFDVEACVQPFPRIYIAVDGGARLETSVDPFIRISVGDGSHIVRMIMKGSVELQERWMSPLEAAVALRSIEADDFLPLPPDERGCIEFLGDSITEGISIDVEPRYRHYGGSNDMVFWDDSTAGYAWLTAESLNMRPIIMGYGCLGTTRKGAGNVPEVCDSYPYYSDGHPMESANAEIIVINHGTNDRGASAEVFARQYTRLLSIVRERSQSSTIIVLTPFCGAWANELRTIVEDFNRENDDNVFYIDSTGWVPPEPLHPTREGHKTISRMLTREIRTIMSEVRHK